MASHVSTTEQIETHCPCTKSYTIIRKTQRGTIYQDDVSNIARWFYSTNNTNNITIIVYGSFHQTFPNPEHLTVEIQYDGITTGKMHLSIDAHGYWYQQQLPNVGYGKKKKRKGKNTKRKGKKKKKKNKSKKKKP